LIVAGDWSFCRSKKRVFEVMRAYREQINCKVIHFIVGNHDPCYRNGEGKRELRDIFTTVQQSMLFRHHSIPCGKMYISHYANRVWPSSHHGAYHLYGHSHGSLRDDPHSLSFDIGVDCHDFKPLNLTQISEIMSQKDWTSPIECNNDDRTT